MTLNVVLWWATLWNLHLDCILWTDYVQNSTLAPNPRADFFCSWVLWLHIEYRSQVELHAPFAPLWHWCSICTEKLLPLACVYWWWTDRLPFSCMQFRKLFPPTKWSAELNAAITVPFFQWLVGPCEVQKNLVASSPWPLQLPPTYNLPPSLLFWCANCRDWAFVHTLWTLCSLMLSCLVLSIALGCLQLPFHSWQLLLLLDVFSAQKKFLEVRREMIDTRKLSIYKVQGRILSVFLIVLQKGYLRQSNKQDK